MAFKLPVEANNEKISLSTKRSFLKVFLQYLPFKKEPNQLEQYAGLHFEAPENAKRMSETASDALFVIDTSFTTKDTYFKHALAEACDAINTTMEKVGHTQLQQYDPAIHQFHAPQQHPLYG